MSRSPARAVIGISVAALSVVGMMLRLHPQATTTTTTTVVSGPSGSTTLTDTSQGDTAVVTVSGPADQVKLFHSLPTPPVGAHKPTGFGNEGLLTTEQFIEADFTSSGWAEERTSLPKRGFQYAVRVYWCTSDTGCVDEFIDHFGTPTQAQSYYLAQSSADAKDYDASGTFAVPGVAESKVFVKKALDSVGNAELNGLACAGSDVVRIDTQTPATPDRTVLDPLMTTTVANLDASQG